MRLIFISFACILLYSCSNSHTAPNTGNADTTNTHSPANREPIHSKLGDAGTQTLMDVMTRYYALKNALVATKAAEVANAATRLIGPADSLQAFLQKDTANKTLSSYADTIAAQAKAISELKDETCEKQRDAFGTLSSAMYGLAKAIDLRNAHVYHDYCPMAFNEKGGYWLSEESEIKNPYFGKKMLECGEVTDSL